MKPDDVSQEAWEMADKVGESIHGRHSRGFVMWPLVSENGNPAQEIVARAITAAVAAELEATLDAASTYLQGQYGYAMLSHPVDRARIAAIRARSVPC